jgi:hypothetical protein
MGEEFRCWVISFVKLSNCIFNIELIVQWGVFQKHVRDKFLKVDQNDTSFWI